MPREVSLTVGSFPRHLNKKPSCYLVHGAVAAEDGVSGLSVVSVVSAALLTSTVPEIPGRPFFRSCYAAAAMSRARPLAAILSHCQPTVIVTASAIVGVVQVSTIS